LSSAFGELCAKETNFFPEPDFLKDNVLFWKKIYTEVSTDEGLLHDRDYPMVIYKKIHIGKRWGKNLSNYLKEEKKKIAAMLEHINTAHPSTWTNEEKRIVSLFEKYKGLSVLAVADDRIRFQQGQRDRFLKGLKNSGKYLNHIRRILKEHNVPLRLAYLPHVESSFNPNARSKCGATGLWQFMHGTGKRFLKINYLVDERYDPILSTVAAAKLLSSNFNELGAWPLAITAYNYGVAGLKRAVQNTGSKDISTIIRHHKSRKFQFASKNFYSCFLAASDIAENYTAYFGNISLDFSLERKRLRLKYHARPSTICNSLNIPISHFKTYNPAIKSKTYSLNSTIPKGYYVYVPPSVSSAKIQKIGTKKPVIYAKDLPQKPKYLPENYKVRAGDYLEKIAMDMGVSVSALAFANNLSSEHRIYAGQILRIPKNDLKTGASKNKIAKKEKAILKYQTYAVKYGDYLGRIAEKMEVSAASIASANNMSIKSRIYPGQILRILLKASNFYFENKKASPKKYRVENGDYLGLIAEKTGVSASSIARANNMSVRDRIYPGQILRIPPKSFSVSSASDEEKHKTYLVKKGDYLERIAQKTGVSVRSIVKVNDISQKHWIYPGQILRIPKEERL
jgi:membrane-bound lytic murein transglycosylase D